MLLVIRLAEEGLPSPASLRSAPSPKGRGVSRKQMPLTLLVHGWGMLMAGSVRGGGVKPFSFSRALMKPKWAPGLT